MAWEHARTVVRKLIRQLPPVPEPWEIDELCQRLAEQRGRELVVYPANVPALPFGLWYDDGERDFVIYRYGVQGYHRDHIILHEICHILAKHNTMKLCVGERGDSDADATSRLIAHMMCNRLNSFQEEVAEIFASRVLELVKRSVVTELNDFERRAANAFGAR